MINKESKISLTFFKLAKKKKINKIVSFNFLKLHWLKTSEYMDLNIWYSVSPLLLKAIDKRHARFSREVSEVLARRLHRVNQSFFLLLPLSLCLYTSQSLLILLPATLWWRYLTVHGGRGGTKTCAHSWLYKLSVCLISLWLWRKGVGGFKVASAERYF